MNVLFYCSSDNAEWTCVTITAKLIDNVSHFLVLLDIDCDVNILVNARIVTFILVMMIYVVICIVG